MINKIKYATLLLASAVVTISSCKNEPVVQLKKEVEVKAVDTANFDKSINPGDDFFRYVNGGWQKRTPIPNEKSRYGAFDELGDSSYSKQRAILEEMSSKTAHKKGSAEQLVGDFYLTASDSNKIEKLGAEPIRKALNEIQSAKSFSEIWYQVARMTASGDVPLFNVFPEQDAKNSKFYIASIYQGGLGLPDRDYYLLDNYESKKTAYQKLIFEMFKLVGDDSTKAEERAISIIGFETELAKNQKTRNELRDPQTTYNKMTVEGMKGLSPELDWQSFFSNIGLNTKVEVNIASPKYITALGKMSKSQPIDAWKNYLAWNLINGSADLLSSKFVEQKFNFYGKELSGAKSLKPRWKRNIDLVGGLLGEAIGKLYVERHFPQEAKTRMLELVENLRSAFKVRLEKLDWMSDSTKKQAIGKLATIKVKIGYPDKFIDYSSVGINKESFYANALLAAKFNFQYQLAKIGKQVDPTEWLMSPQTVNAYYNPPSNEIVFPAAILQPPFFNMKADDAVNYGGIGAVIGHEITHGFDDQGRQYDKDGNLIDWWTKVDTKKFTAKAKDIIKQYNKFSPLPDKYVDGNLTLGENIADLGGVTISYDALQIALKGKKDKIDGFTPEQRFFINYAQIWRQNIRPQEMEKRLVTDVHAPAEFRVNGVLTNFTPFYNAFNLKKGNKLFKPEAERTKIW